MDYNLNNNNFVNYSHENNDLYEANSTINLSINSAPNGVPLYLKILSSFFYIASMVLGIGGNTFLLVFMYILRTKSVTQFFIINLAISDLIFAVLCIPSTYITAYLIQYWPFTSFFCIFLNYMQTVSVTLTVYTLIWLTLDKFWGLVKPLKLRMSIKVCKLLIALSWIFSLFVSLPIALFTKLTYTNLSSGGFPQCNEQWPDSLLAYANYYNVLLVLIQYFVPLVILSYCYARIGIVLKRSKAPGEIIHHRDARMTQSKKKV
jgi:neuropeptide Y receptor